VTAGSLRLTAFPRGRRFHLDAAALITAAAFLVLFYQPLRLLVRDWWTDPDAGHGLLLAPLAVWLAWRDGLEEPARPSTVAGASILAGAVLLRYLSGLAAELFTMRVAVLGAIVGLIVFYRGWGQVRRSWLPLALLALSIPLPSLLTASLTLPLQLRASALGAWMLHLRHVPVLLSGNIIQLPGHQLFVTEACSGLRSLTALLSLSLLVAGLWLHRPAGRLLLVLVTIPIALGINAVRVFLTGFLVYFVDPRLGDGFMHLTEGWVMFVIAFASLATVGWGLAALERRFAVTSPRG
jgi:exosortase